MTEEEYRAKRRAIEGAYVSQLNALIAEFLCSSSAYTVGDIVELKKGELDVRSAMPCMVIESVHVGKARDGVLFAEYHGVYAVRTPAMSWRIFRDHPLIMRDVSIVGKVGEYSKFKRG